MEIWPAIGNFEQWRGPDGDLFLLELGVFRDLDVDLSLLELGFFKVPLLFLHEIDFFFGLFPADENGKVIV